MISFINLKQLLFEKALFSTEVFGRGRKGRRLEFKEAWQVIAIFLAHDPEQLRSFDIAVMQVGGSHDASGAIFGNKRKRQMSGLAEIEDVAFKDKLTNLTFLLLGEPHGPRPLEGLLLPDVLILADREAAGISVRPEAGLRAEEGCQALHLTHHTSPKRRYLNIKHCHHRYLQVCGGLS
ncbi:unnamed protein product [Nezara viridula]|uniref:Uncharacterized protein n=1 Tax=Nezara viridula TaxID=85310 RepID=A0A9P0MXM1_NEZVI|nr:unnamed protein product [Nezara viridula]